MNIRYCLLILLILFQIRIFSQITVSQTGTVSQWVQNTLVGPGITVSNVTYSGSPLAIGTFTTGATATNLGFNAGLILSSGKAIDAPGPNNSGSQTTAFNLGGDAQLAASINTPIGNIKDAAVLEFDFIPVSDTVKFRYVFGSEEYDEFVGSSYNDVFGFFVSGLNPYGGWYTNQNIAIIPNTSTPVSINNVNNGSTNSGPCNNCAFYSNNSGGQGVQYDGKTVVLTAWLRVIPCFTYHIKIAIADVGDYSYDSGVFLEKNSFMSNSIIIEQNTSNTIDTSAIEGCNDAIITFRIPHPRTTNTIINYLPTGTAVNGVDYSLIPNQVVIPAGLDSVNIVIHPILDGITEPTEYIRLIVNTSACTYDTTWIYIKDNNLTVPVLPPDTVLCGNNTIPLSVNTTGGYAPYSYLWNTGDTLQNITITPTASTLYTVTVTDQCANDSTVSVWVKVSEPDFSVVNDTICQGESGRVEIIPNIPLLYSWVNGSASSSLNISPSATTSYNVRITDTLGCFVDTFATMVVNPVPQILITDDKSICRGDTVILRVSGGNNYFWSNNSIDSTLFLKPLATTKYTVTVTNLFDCAADSFVSVFVLPLPNALITTSIDTLCKGSMAVLTASGGDNYIWNTGTTGSEIEIRPIETTNYSVIASFSSPGLPLVCRDTFNFRQNVKRCNRFYMSSAFSPNGDGLNDVFNVVGVFTNIDNFEFFVFDRWGKVVFYTKDVLEGWDGKIDGSPALGGVYTYKVIIRETFAEEYVLIGSFHLIR